MPGDSKRSDFPCPMIISGKSRSTAQARESARISDTFAKKLDTEASGKGREINRRNNDYLAEKRRRPKSSPRKPS